MRSPTGASAALLRLARQGRVTMLANVALAVEYEAVCSGADQARAAGLSPEEVGVFLDAVLAMVEPVETYFMWRPMLRDPADEMVLEAAVNGGAKAVVTFNLKDFSGAAARFGVQVATPGEIARTLTP